MQRHTSDSTLLRYLVKHKNAKLRLNTDSKMFPHSLLKYETVTRSDAWGKLQRRCSLVFGELPPSVSVAAITYFQCKIADDFVSVYRNTSSTALACFRLQA